MNITLCCERTNWDEVERKVHSLTRKQIQNVLSGLHRFNSVKACPTCVFTIAGILLCALIEKSEVKQETLVGAESSDISAPPTV